MISPGILTVAYLTDVVLFIRSLGGLSQQTTARQGNLFGIIGMVIAVVVTAVAWVGDDISAKTAGLAILIASVGIGGSVGAVLARRVEMTGMPELVAILHSFVGLAAVLVGISSYLHPHHTGKLESA